MGNSPSIPGLGGGRPHVKRDMAKDDRKAELRPVNPSTSSSESELSEEEKDEQFDKEFREKLTSGTNRKSSNEVTQRSSFRHKSHNHALCSIDLAVISDTYPHIPYIFRNDDHRPTFCSRQHTL